MRGNACRNCRFAHAKSDGKTRPGRRNGRPIGFHSAAPAVKTTAPSDKQPLQRPTSLTSQAFLSYPLTRSAYPFRMVLAKVAIEVPSGRGWICWKIGARRAVVRRSIRSFRQISKRRDDSPIERETLASGALNHRNGRADCTLTLEPALDCDFSLQVASRRSRKGRARGRSGPSLSDLSGHRREYRWVPSS